MLQRRIIVETSNMDRHGRSKPGNNRRPGPGMHKVAPRWRPVEKKIKGTAIVEVNELPLRVPKYSFKVGTVRLDDNGQVLETIPFLNHYNVDDGIDVLTEMREKYARIREEKQREYDAAKRHDDDDDDDPNYGSDNR